jgi:hypothetical protein
MSTQKSKKAFLAEQAKLGATRKRVSKAAAPLPKKKPFVMVPFAVRPAELEWLDEATRKLQKVELPDTIGAKKPNRSLLLRDGLLRLKEAFETSEPTALLQQILERQERHSKKRKE